MYICICIYLDSIMVISCDYCYLREKIYRVTNPFQLKIVLSEKLNSRVEV